MEEEEENRKVVSRTRQGFGELKATTPTNQHSPIYHHADLRGDPPLQTMHSQKKNTS